MPFLVSLEKLYVYGQESKKVDFLNLLKYHIMKKNKKM